MKIFILIYYVAYLFTKIFGAKLPDNDLKIAKLIGFVNNMYSDDDLSDAWGGRYGRIYPRSQTETVLKPSPDEDAAQQTLRKEVEEMAADEPPYRRIGPENIRLTINGLLSTKPRVNQNYHIETQRFKKNNEEKKKPEEESITLPKDNARQGQTQKEILEFVLLKENERIKKMKQEDRKEKSLRSKKDKRTSKDNRQPKDKDKTSNKKKEQKDTDKKKSKKKSSVRNKSKKKDVKKESDLKDKKINRNRKETHLKNLHKKTKTENNKKRKRKNENNKKRKEKNEKNSKSWKITDRERNFKSDKLERDWNRRHREYDDYDNNQFDNDIGIIDNASDMNMEEEWNKRHPLETKNSEIQNSFERN